MQTQTTAARTTAFKIGWGVLLAISALAALNHIVLAFALPDEATLFIGWAAFNVYSLVVLYIPFGRGEKWAWRTTWVLALAFASVIFLSAEFGAWYLGAAVLMAASLLLTWPTFSRHG